MLYRWILIGVGILSAIFLVGGSHGVTGELTPEEAARYEALQSQSFTTFSNVDLADYLQLRNKLLAKDPLRPIPAEEIGHYACRAVGLPYRINAVLFDLGEGDCVSWTQRTIAMACTSDWDSYYKLCERIRHKDGIVTFRNRNFFTLGDLMPNNAWLWRDLTGDLGPAANRPAERFTHVVRPKVFVDRPGDTSGNVPIFKGSDYKSGRKEVLTDLYIPRNRIPDVLPDLRTGDIVLVLRPSAGGNLGCDHMGLLVRRPDGEISFAHCVPHGTRQEVLTDFLNRCKWIAGLKFLCLRENARDLVKQELVRLGSGISVPTPAEQDEKIRLLRLQRSGASEPRLTSTQP